MGYVDKTHFRQYQMHNYTQCVKNNIIFTCLTHSMYWIYKEYRTIVNTQQVLILQISSGWSHGWEESSGPTMAKSSTAWQPCRLVECFSPTTAMSLLHVLLQRYISTPLYTSTAHLTVTSKVMEWSSCCRFTPVFAWNWYSSACFMCIPPHLV